MLCIFPINYIIVQLVDNMTNQSFQNDGIVVIGLNLNSASLNNRNRMHLRRYHLFLVLLLVIAIEYIARVHRVFVMRVCQH